MLPFSLLPSLFRSRLDFLAFFFFFNLPTLNRFLVKESWGEKNVPGLIEVLANGFSYFQCPHTVMSNSLIKSDGRAEKKSDSVHI